MSSIYLSTAYFPPIQYFAKMLGAEQVFVEAHEHFIKQTYRSRCQIATANGALALTVPVQKKSGVKMPIREVRIDYTEQWQRQHWRSLVAAYQNSPFFEYYADELLPFFEQKETFLFDLNQKLIIFLNELLNIAPPLYLTQAYDKCLASNVDFRTLISPKQNLQSDTNFTPANYYQCFVDRKGFLPNLSILDLLFNEGNEARSILRNSISV
ncbi:MAG: WbqC family protein [Bacteroidales bacterium]